MPVIGQSFAERFSRWQVLANNLKLSPATNTALVEELVAIDGLLAQARELQDRQAQLRGQAREVTQQLVTIARDGDRVRRRMGAVLAGKLGFTNDELIRYGFRPRKLPIRRRPRQAPPAGEQPPAGQQPPVGQQPPAGTAPAPTPGTAAAAAPAPQTAPAATAPRS